MQCLVHRKLGRENGSSQLFVSDILYPTRILIFPLGKPFVFWIYQSESGGIMQHPQLSIWETRNCEWDRYIRTQTIGRSHFPFTIF